MLKKILQIIFALFILAMLAFAGAIIRELYIDEQSRSFYEELANGVETRHERVVHEEANDDESENQNNEDEWIPFVNFEHLSTAYPGIIAWIKLDGTVLDYPVMQYTNNDYFLSRLPDGISHRNGSIFLDYRNESDFSDKSILIYGHETRAGDMFGMFKNFRNQGFYEEHPVIHLFTPEKDFKIVLFAGHLANSFTDHPPLEFEGEYDFMEYIDHIRNISVFSSNVEVDADDIIVSLVTCAYDFNDARLVLVGILEENLDQGITAVHQED